MKASKLFLESLATSRPGALFEQQLHHLESREKANKRGTDSLRRFDLTERLPEPEGVIELNKPFILGTMLSKEGPRLVEVDYVEVEIANGDIIWVDAGKKMDRTGSPIIDDTEPRLIMVVGRGEVAVQAYDKFSDYGLVPKLDDDQNMTWVHDPNVIKNTDPEKIALDRFTSLLSDSIFNEMLA